MEKINNPIQDFHTTVIQIVLCIAAYFWAVVCVCAPLFPAINAKIVGRWHSQGFFSSHFQYEMYA